MKNIWRGKNIRLRAACTEDGFLFADNKGDMDTETQRRYDYIDFPLADKVFGKRIEQYLTGEYFGHDFLFVIEDDIGRPVGFIITFDCDQKMGTFKYGLFLTEDAKGKGYGSEAAKIVFNYYFNELRYNKVNVYIYDYNTPSLRFHEKLGFVKEGCLRQMAYSMGCYHDAYFYGMLKDEFNSLNPQYLSDKQP